MRCATQVLGTLVVGALVACATPEKGSATRIVLALENGTALHAGPGSFVLRNPEHVVALPPFGEIHVGVEGDASRCRFVWSRDGIASLSVLEGTRCPAREGDRICFADTRFPTNGTVPTLVVDGCAYENDLKWSKLQGPAPATLGPTAWRRRCAPVPAQAAGCELTFVRVTTVEVSSNPEAARGFSFDHDSDGWRVCFLEKDSGPYRVALDVEDSCGARTSPILEGDSRTLDD